MLKASINLKCNPEKAVELRATYEAVNPGYHMSKVHWNTVTLNGDVGDKMVCAMIVDSYDLVFNSLTKKVREEMGE